jgi:hypothetical protein
LVIGVAKSQSAAGMIVRPFAVLIPCLCWAAESCQQAAAPSLLTGVVSARPHTLCIIAAVLQRLTCTLTKSQSLHYYPIPGLTAPCLPGPQTTACRA